MAVRGDVNMWLRAGLGYFRASDDYQDAGTGASAARTSSIVLGSMEPLFVYTPVPHAGVVFGANLDFTISGEAELEGSAPGVGSVGSASGDLSLFGYGVASGMILFL